MSDLGGGVSIPVKNPYTGEVDYQITPPTAGELTELCDSLRAAQVKWAAAPLSHRVEVMLRWADELDAAYGPLSAADFTDTGGCLIALMSPRIVASSVRSWAADAVGVLAAAAAPPAPLSRPAPPPAAATPPAPQRILADRIVKFICPRGKESV